MMLMKDQRRVLLLFQGPLFRKHSLLVCKRSSNKAGFDIQDGAYYNN
jgi:hypothetical protein